MWQQPWPGNLAQIKLAPAVSADNPALSLTTSVDAYSAQTPVVQYETESPGGVGSSFAEFRPVVTGMSDLLPSVRRHGDKGREMQLLSLTAYGQAAEKLTMHNPLAFKRAAFISSEDPDVIRDAHNLTTFGVDGAIQPLASRILESRSCRYVPVAFATHGIRDVQIRGIFLQ